MNKFSLALTFVVLISQFIFVGMAISEDKKDAKVATEPGPYDKYLLEKGYLKVTDGHELYYEVVGNPKGVPVLYLHGGPGGGFSDRDKKYYNLDHYKVILLDQRGAGRSKPYASIEANTTDLLVDDINVLLDHLKIKKTFLFGGSWGSTLALVYTIRNPHRVTGMLLRGIFLCTEEEDKHFVGGGVQKFFPEVWERFISQVPKDKRNDPISYYLGKIQSKNDKESLKYAFEFVLYEISISGLNMNLAELEKKIAQWGDGIKAFAITECYYLTKHCFFPENYIMDNIAKIPNIPVTIVQGRYDMICPPETAVKLSKALKKAKLILLPCGHSAREELMDAELTAQMKEFEKLFK
jgi:proline iminopeptidase